MTHELDPQHRAFAAPSRRTVLRGLGTLVALPFLERFASASGAPAPVRRIVFVYAPNGVRRDRWFQAADGAIETLPSSLEPLAPHRNRVRMVAGLALDKARANGDGPGDHARAAAAFLTCAQPLKRDGAVRAGTSVDQVAARTAGRATRFSSLAIGGEEGSQNGQCDSGYACAYSSNLSWTSATTPLAKETDAQQLFDRLFRDGDPLESDAARAERRARRTSVLDYVRDDARRLAQRLGAADRAQLEAYETSVRELERRLEHALERERSVPANARPADGSPRDHAQHLDLLSDVLALALATDATRIATFAFANEGSNRGFAALGAPEGHHELSHHGNDAEKLEKIARIDRFHAQRLAHLLERIATAREAGESVLDSTLVLFGSGIGDGNRHDHHDLPILLCGGPVTAAERVSFPRDTPLANLHAGLLRWMGVEAAGFGDSNGVIDVG